MIASFVCMDNENFNNKVHWSNLESHVLEWEVRALFVSFVKVSGGVEIFSNSGVFTLISC